MPLHDYHCRCGFNFEMFVKWDEYEMLCPRCNKHMAKRVYSHFGGLQNNAPGWIRDVLEVVDKDGGIHCQEFIRRPTRDNYKNWMKKEGVRPLEEGESMKRNKVIDTSAIRAQVHKNFRKRNTVEVRG